VTGLAYLTTGFAVVWFFLACYLFWIGHRQRRLQVRLERLETEAGHHRPDIDLDT
jgi:CcmD family protein